MNSTTPEIAPQSVSLEDSFRSWNVEADNSVPNPSPKVDPKRDETSFKGGHIPALDALRGIAILAVTFYRFRLGPDDTSIAGETLQHLLHLGNRGVDLFFVLSGFLITGILYDAKNIDPHYFRNFYARRSLRIFPLYFGSLALFLLLLPAVTTLPSAFDAPREQQAWLWTYCSNILMSIRGTWCFGALDHFWSLAVEEHFYFFWPLVIFLCTRKQACMLAIGLAAGAALARIALSVLSEPGVVVDVATWFRCDALLVGALFALLLRAPGGVARTRKIAWCAFGLGLVLSLPSLLSPELRIKTIPHSTFALMFGGVVALAATSSPKSSVQWIWQNKILRMFGKYSYAMYVFQAPLIPLLAPWLTAGIIADSVGSVLAGRLIYIATMSTLTFALALLSWNLLEKHCLKLKSRFESHR
jgi:peptidoglycan/LPS O-acetylase OafA/YrhL